MTMTMKSKNAMTTENAIRHLVLHDADISVDGIADKLDALGLHVPTSFYIGTKKGFILSVVRFLRKEGLLVDKAA
jgi:hypothetical protein